MLCSNNTNTMSALLLDELKRDDSKINPFTRADLVLFVNSQYSDYTAPTSYLYCARSHAITHHRSVFRIAYVPRRNAM